MQTYFAKVRGRGTALPAKPSLRFVFWSWLGACLAIAATGWLSETAGAPFLMAPFGASCVLVFGVPGSPLAQPRNLVLGHLLAGIVGLTFLMAFGAAWWAMGLAVATAIAVMLMTRTVHPPAGATSLVVMLQGADWPFLLTPVLSGSLVLLVIALVTNNLARDRSYPEYW